MISLLSSVVKLHSISPTALARFERTWRTLQSELAALSTDSIQIVVEGAGH